MTAGRVTFPLVDPASADSALLRYGTRCRGEPDRMLPVSSSRLAERATRLLLCGSSSPSTPLLPRTVPRVLGK